MARPRRHAASNVLAAASDIAGSPREQRSTTTDDSLLHSGLTTQQVLERKRLGLDNRIPETSSRSLISILRANILTLFNAVVGGSFLLLLILGQWKDALFGFAVISNMLIGIIQEYSSKRTLDKIAILNQPRARVLRNGQHEDIAVAEVVLDDALLLRAGDQVPADALVLTSAELQVDESLLTGEAEPVDKSPGDAVLSGSSVIAGTAVARAVKVGTESYSSVITQEARRFSLVRSELRNALARIIRWISWALVPLMLVALNGQMQAAGGWVAAWHTGAWTHAAVASIASIISMIPQGLVLITSISFAMAAVSLARRKVLVQELPAVEGLARVDVVCFDKTGTLTRGDITLRDVSALDTSKNTSAHERILGLFSTSQYANATAIALRDRYEEHADGARVEDEIAFSSARKWSALRFDGTWWFLGAPELLLAGQASEEQTLERIKGPLHDGMRVLLLCRTDSPVDTTRASLPTQLDPVAILALSETVRGDAAETIEYFLDQGLQLKVISGDNPDTVAAIARQAGIPNAERARDAREFGTDLSALADALESHSVFGRVTPEQKKAMVLALQSRGHVVAMTGDGVNDALALKTADLGVAMGNGSAATKAVSRIVLLDNAFAMLPIVVGEGRRVIANVERVSRLFLTKTSWAMLLAIVFGMLLWPFPFLPRQLSGIDGYTIGIASFFLALLPNQRRYMPGFLKRSLMFCIPSGLVIGIAVIAFTAILRIESIPTVQTQTGVAMLLSLTGLWVLVTLSRPYDVYKWGITAAMYALFILMFTVPLARDFFGFSEISSPVMLVTGTIALIAISLIEVTHQSVSALLRRKL